MMLNNVCILPASSRGICTLLCGIGGRASTRGWIGYYGSDERGGSWHGFYGPRNIFLERCMHNPAVAGGRILSSTMHRVSLVR